MQNRQLTLRLSEELAGQLDLLSRRTGLSRAVLVRAALKQYLQEQREQTRPIDLVRDLLDGASLACEGGSLSRDEMIQKIREHNVRPA